MIFKKTEKSKCLFLTTLEILKYCITYYCGPLVVNPVSRCIVDGAVCSRKATGKIMIATAANTPIATSRLFNKS